MANRGVEHHHHHRNDLDASSVVGGLLLARHNLRNHHQQQQQQPPQISPPIDDDNQRGRNQAHHLPSFGEHPWDNPPSLRHDPPPLPQHRQSSQARGEPDDDRASLDDVEGDDEAHCSGLMGGGRLAIAFLLNPSGAGAATTSTSTATSTSTSASAGHKRKADDDYDHAGRTTPGSSFPVPQQVAASRGDGGGGGAAELEERDDDANDRQLRRRRLEQQLDEPPPAIEGDARYSLHHQPHLQQQHQQQHQRTHYQRAVLPSLSSIIMTGSPPPSATMPADLYHAPHHRTSPQRSSPPSPMMPSPSPRALPAAGGFSPFHSPAPSPAASCGTSFAMGLSLADPSFFFHSFNCLPSAMSTRMDSEPEAPPPPPPGSSSSSSSDSSAGFYYTPYERSQSAPSSPKLYVGDDAGLPEGEEAEEDYCGAPPPRQGNTTTALTPEQLQLRLQTQALQTQLLVRQMQRKQNVQQLKRLHAQQRRQRFEVHSASASASFASSPSRAGEGGRKRSRGSRGQDGGEFDDDDDDGYNEENGGSKDEDGADRGEKRSAFEQQHNKELMARKLEDKLKLLKEKIMGAGDSVEDGDGDSSSSGKTPQEKRKRATPQQLKLLEEVFAVDPFPAREAKQLLAQKLGMSIRSITIWFQNKRARLKKFAEKSGTM